MDGRSESLVLSHLPVGDIVLMFPSRLGRGHRDSVTNKTMGAVCSPQERRAAAAKTRCGVNRNVVAGDAAVLRTKLRARLPRPGRSPPTGGGTALWHRSRQKRGHRGSDANKNRGAVCSPQELSIKKYSSSRQMSTTSVRDEEFFHVLPPCLGKTQFCPAHFP